MSLTELLDSVGMTKAQLAVALCVSPSTVKRMGDVAPPEVIQLVDSMAADQIPSMPEPARIPLAAKVKPWQEYTRDEVKALCMHTGGYEAIARDKRDRETEYEVACSIGLQVHEFNAMRDNYAKTV